MFRVAETFGVLLGLLLAPVAQAQFWQKKSYEQWSAGDCKKLLKDSPWVKTRTLSRVFIQRIEEQAAVEGRENAPQINYTVQLLSALPVRQAMVRQSQLDPRVAKLDPEQKQAFDKGNADLLNRQFAEHVLVQILYSTNAQAYDRELANYWQTRPEAELQQDIYLIYPGGKVRPLRIIVAKGGANHIQLFFPRQVDGKPILEPTAKSLSLEFPHPTVGVLTAERVFIEFKVKDMVVNSQLHF